LTWWCWFRSLEYAPPQSIRFNYPRYQFGWVDLAFSNKIVQEKIIIFYIKTMQHHQKIHVGAVMWQDSLPHYPLMCE